VPVSRLWWLTGPLLVVLVFATVFVLARPVPYVALMPGSARSVEPLVTVSRIDGGPRPQVEKPDDDLFFVTVRVRRPSGLEALYRLLRDANEVVPEDYLTGGQSQEENRRFNLQLMTDSKDKATKVALERSGYEVKVKATGAVVVDTGPDYPVSKVVRPGDTIVEANGTPIATTADLVGVIAAAEPGDEIALTVEPFGAADARKVSAKLVANPETGKAQLGVSLENRPSYEFPLQVDIDSGEVGGPSAGLAFTLAIIDRLTPGDLTGDTNVAVTGTINLDASVGPVGGVVQKTEAAISEGAKLFLVPADEFAGATEAARGRIEVRQVTTLEEAIGALEAAGGDPIPDTGKAPPGNGAGG
jgi:PDZ domain-containing protein